MKLRIVIDLPSAPARAEREQDLSSALANYFDDRASALQHELKELSRIGRRYLSIVLLVLLIGFIAISSCAPTLVRAPFRAIEESLLILGWIANWQPLETFPYDWWPLKRRRDLCRRLEHAGVDIRSRPARGPKRRQIPCPPTPSPLPSQE